MLQIVKEILLYW